MLVFVRVLKNRLHIGKVLVHVLHVSPSCPVKVPISSKFFIFLSDSIYHPMKVCEKKFDFDKMQSFLEVLKTLKFFGRAFSLRHQITCFWKHSNWPPFWSTIRTSLPLVRNELWHRFSNTWLQAWFILLVLPL